MRGIHLCQSCAYLNRVDNIAFGIAQKMLTECAGCGGWRWCVKVRVDADTARQRVKEFRRQQAESEALGQEQEAE